MSSEPALRMGQPAPAGYYQNNLIVAFRFVLQRYRATLPASYALSLDEYLAASGDGQRLLARLLTRKGPYFLRAGLEYSEIDSTDRALTELTERGLLCREPGPADLLLRRITKQSLFECFHLPKLLRAQPKAMVIEHILGQYNDQAICRRLLVHAPWVRLKHPEHWQLARFLFFGTTNQDWSTFVLKDLGHTRYESMPLKQPQYTDAQALNFRLTVQQLQRASYRLDEYPLLADGLLISLKPMIEKNKEDSRLQRCAVRLGHWAERNQYFDLALEAYGLAEMPPARERRVRILHRLGRTIEANALHKAMRACPRSAKEAVFAERFGRRNAGFQPIISEMEIAGCFDSVEQYALTKLLKPGGWGLHCENTLFKSFAGLLYWPVIFADVDGAFTNPFQAGPHDLFEEAFCHRRQSLLAKHERRLADDEAFVAMLLDTLKQKHGIANRLVNWSLFETIPLHEWLKAMPINVIRLVAAFLIRNLNDYRTGFPDLFLCHGFHDFEFVEVKGPGDQLQPQQRAWLKQLATMDLPARILKLHKP
ncbi:MAG: VRR-NUC domain-containing protein [Pseudomonadota bacterium]|nr:VRR-NUC domain-containing protein [Pseudomonadota bacterium]